MIKLLLRALVSATLAVAFATATQAALTPTALHLDVPVSDIGTDNNLAQSNTSRKLAVAPDGTIYALFRSAANGIRIAKSTNRGQSFAPSIQISATDGSAEIGIASDGDLHVVWAAGSTGVFHAVSRDGGQTFSSPVTVIANSSTSMHMALDGDRVYLVAPIGTVVYVSADDGATFTQTTVTSTPYAYSDIFVDPLTHDVIAISDNPSVYFRISHDSGQTFSAAVATGKSVYYSVGALSVTSGHRYMFLAGSLGNLERIEIDTPSYFTGTVPQTSGSTTRSLSADIFGNVVSGYLDSSNTLSFVNSNDLGLTFASPTVVAQSATRANAAINTINGDVLFLYEKANQIYLSTYSQGLIDYDVNVSPTALNFGSVEVGSPSSLPITLTSVSTGAVAIGAITATSGYSTTDNCNGSLAPLGTCTVTVTFDPTAAGATPGTLSMALGSISRPMALAGVGIPPRQTTSVQLSASPTNAPLGENITLTATVSGSPVTGTVTFSEGGTPISGCSNIALSSSTATCTVSNPTAGAKHYTAAYSGDTSNKPSDSSGVAVSVGMVTVTPSAGAGGAISPATPQTVTSGGTATFTLTANTGFRIDVVSGCGGTLAGAAYTTGAVTADCTVSATFAQANEQVEVVAKSKGGGGAMDLVLLMGSLCCLIMRGLRTLARKSWPLFVATLALGRVQADESRWYVGGAIGEDRSDRSRTDVEASLAQSGFSAASVDLSRRDRDAYRVFGGYRITPNWAIEVGYTDMGTSRAVGSATVPIGQAQAYAQALLDALPASPSGYEASASFRYPLSEVFAVGVRAGAWRWRSDLRASYGDNFLHSTPDGTDALFGANFEWTPILHWAFGLEASRYKTSGQNFDLLGVDAKFLW